MKNGNKLLVEIPKGHTPEREYAVNALLTEILGIENVTVHTTDTKNYLIRFENYTIAFADAFFGRFANENEYLNADNLPQVFFAHNSFTVDKDIPVLYGTGDIDIALDSITCGIDIFAGVFFMLARWEEHVVRERDAHGRFASTSSTAARHGFLHRPVVNEYAEMLWNMLGHMGCHVKRKSHKFDLHLTHDVDILESNNVFVASAGDILKRHDLKLALSRFAHIFHRDEVDTFDQLMNLSEMQDKKAIFFLLATHHDPQSPTSRNYLRRRRFRALVDEIRERGHIMGYHPGYHTHDNAGQWQAEYKHLCAAIEAEPTICRQHYLRVSVPHTWRIMDENRMTKDYTMSYADCEGFRCGTGCTFHLFDVEQRRRLQTTEQPLVAMDSTLFEYRKMNEDEAFDVLTSMADTGLRYSMPVTLLIHNSIADSQRLGMYADVIRYVQRLQHRTPNNHKPRKR